MMSCAIKPLAVKPTCISKARNFAGLPARPLRTTVVAKASKEFDFDDMLMNIANDVTAKYEKAENKTAVIGYTAAAAAAILTAEWLIHLPLFNVVLGFPIQLLGLLTLPYLGIKYYVEGANPTDDAEVYLKKVTDQLPGLGKKN